MQHIRRAKRKKPYVARRQAFGPIYDFVNTLTKEKICSTKIVSPSPPEKYAMYEKNPLFWFSPYKLAVRITS